MLDSFIEKAKRIHGDRYDYSKTDYKNNSTKICIICPVHGEFWQTPKNHLKGCNCPKCSGTYNMTTNEWIEKAKRIHGDKYDYSKVNYKSNKGKVCIICPVHGEFWQIAANHLKGEGCKKCRDYKMSINRKITKDIFLEKAKEKYGNFYDYSKVHYVDYYTRVCIIDPVHGEFWQTPKNHLSKKKIFKGKKEKKEKTDYGKLFIERANKIYGNKYDYSKVNYKNASKKVAIICPKHGEFLKSPQKHLLGQGCPKCIKEKHNEKKYESFLTFLNKAKTVHGDKYSYEKSSEGFITNRSKITITCKKHGDFLQQAASHLHGCGCPRCAQEERSRKQAIDTETFIQRAKKVFPEYDYTKTNYVNRNTPIQIVCHSTFKNGKEHGEFLVLPSKFLERGMHCPHCSRHTSWPEMEVYDFICGLVGKENVLIHNRTILEGVEIDMYIPTLKIGIEFNGLYWHSDAIDHINKESHIVKTNKCEELGIRLIQIFSDEFFEHKDIVFSKIKHLLGLNTENRKIMARKTKIKEINFSVAKQFLDIYHIQGSCNSTIYLGAFYNDELIGVMSFVKENADKHFCLNRFATKTDVVCSGVGSKIFSYFIKNYDCNYIKSFADRRWSNRYKNIYLSIGFKEDGIIPPDYRYIYKNKPSLGRMHKFNFRKQILHKKYGFPLTMTEREMTKELGLSRVYDCGLIKYVWERNDEE